MQKIYTAVFVILMTWLAAPQKAMAQEDTTDFNKQLMDVENEVNDLKERFFKSKATLRLLKESIVQGAIQGAQVNVWYRNELSSAYVPQSILCRIDGKEFSTNPTEASSNLASQREYKIISTNLSAEQHTIEVVVKLNGNGKGLFSYVNKYSFEVKGGNTFTPKQGDECTLYVKLEEKKGFALSFLDRPTISFEQKCAPMSGIE